MIVIDQFPEKILEIDRLASLEVIRETFRNLCLRYACEFSGQKRSKWTWEQIRLSYQIFRGNLKGPATVLNQQLSTTPFTLVQPSHIIPSLHPMKCVNITHKPDYRAFPMFSIVCSVCRFSPLITCSGRSVFNSRDKIHFFS